MNKKEMAAALAKKAGLSQVKSMEIINHIFSADADGIISSELGGDNKVTIPGFGTFQVKTRAARVGTHPASGKRINIPAKKHVVFKPGKTLREVIGE
ncbi:MAG: HU family DNA-binding protein [Myxococcota bacterium]|jgi:nucleoid DNA-binding protein|nr:HU family DNA-binding protein [Myxococcota bacterium]